MLGPSRRDQRTLIMSRKQKIIFLVPLLIWRPIRTEPKTSRKDLFEHSHLDRQVKYWEPWLLSVPNFFSLGEKINTAFIQALTISCLDYYNSASCTLSSNLGNLFIVPKICPLSSFILFFLYTWNSSCMLNLSNTPILSS